jgi:hypothetical protein
MDAGIKPLKQTVFKNSLQQPVENLSPVKPISMTQQKPSIIPGSDYFMPMDLHPDFLREVIEGPNVMVSSN